jgi:hypothetical protein
MRSGGRGSRVARRDELTGESQPLVDAAFLAQAILRALTALGAAMSSATKCRRSLRWVDAGHHARVQQLAAMAAVEAALKHLTRRGPRARRLRPAAARAVYKGDGLYGDGPQFTGTTTTA